MKKLFSKLLSLSMIASLFVVPSTYAIGPGDLVVDKEAVLTVSPDLIFSQYDITVDVAVEGGVNLPDVELPDTGDLTLEEWLAVNPAEYADLLAALDAEYDEGKDYLRFGLARNVGDEMEEVIFEALVLVQDDLYLTLTDEGFKMSLPGGDDGIDLSAGTYTVRVNGYDYGSEEYIYGTTEFVVSDFPILDLSDFGIFDGFFLPGDDEDEEDVPLEMPIAAGIQISPSVVDEGGEVVVNLLAADMESVTVLPEGWEIGVWPWISLFGSDPILGTEDGGILVDGPGLTFSFDAPSVGAYLVDLIDDEGTIVASEVLDVEVAEDDGFNGEDFGGIIDLSDLLGDLGIPDLFGDEDAEEDVEDDADEEVENVVESTDCADTDLTYWGLEYINPLIDEGVYPVVSDGPVVNCRPQDAVLRKEFTAWLLAAYEPELVAAIDEVDTSETGFSDVASDDVYAPYIVAAAELGIINGNPDGTFAPDAQINRAEVLKILLRSSELFMAEDDEFGVLAADHSLDLVNPDPVVRFSDVSGDDWYYRYLYYGAAKEIIQGYGDGTAKMGQGVLYAEAAKILYLARELGA